MRSIFSGIRILDVTKVFSGPFATRMFADYGAEVLKIEDIHHPDDTRNYPPIRNNWSGYFEILNRNKKGLALRLSEENDRQKLYMLCKEADIFVENLAPLTKDKLHIDYKTLKQINPKLIYASLSGEGQDTNTKYYDVIAQAASGLMSLSGTPQTPMKIGPSVVDAFSGMTLAFALASALYYREKTRIGQYVDVTMLGCAMNLLESNLIAYSITKSNPPRTGNIDNLISPFGAYKTKDGYIVIAVGNDKLWQQLLHYLKSYKSSIDEALFTTNTLRLNNNDTLTQLIESITATATSEEIVNQLQTLGIPCSKVCSMEDVYKNNKHFEKDFIQKIQHPSLGTCVIPGSSIKFSHASKHPITNAPSLGEDNKMYDI